MKSCPCGTALTWRDRFLLFGGAYCGGCRFRMSMGMPPRGPRGSELGTEGEPEIRAEVTEKLGQLLMAPLTLVIEHECALPPLKWPSRWSCPECGIWWSCLPRKGGARWIKEATPVSDELSEADRARMSERVAAVSASVLGSQGATWDAKQRAAAPGFFYGDGGTIHGTTHLDVEVDADGVVVAVWYRCRQLPFVQVLVGDKRAEEMRAVREEGAHPKLTGVHLLDP
jgi:hypothetical protein